LILINLTQIYHTVWPELLRDYVYVL